jgi:hypothetical protein
MLRVKTIVGIVKDDSGNIDFVLEDKNKNVTTTRYVSEYVNVRIGTVRNVVNEYEGLKSGMKIIAKESGISGFLKKNVNIIVGFIIDSGAKEPFVLCSNCMTLWYSDVIEKFNIIEKTDSTWQKMPHSPIDITKIKIQTGDIVTLFKDIKRSYLLCKNVVTRIISLDSYISTIYTYSMDHGFRSNMILDCIISPRNYKKDPSIVQEQLMPTLHGTYKRLGLVNHCPEFEVSEKGIIS